MASSNMVLLPAAPTIAPFWCTKFGTQSSGLNILCSSMLAVTENLPEAARKMNRGVGNQVCRTGRCMATLSSHYFSFRLSVAALVGLKPNGKWSKPCTSRFMQQGSNGAKIFCLTGALRCPEQFRFLSKKKERTFTVAISNDELRHKRNLQMSCQS